MRGPQFLTANQVLLTTLVVKLAVMAALATMLVRYRRFRHILIFERRAWPDRLVFALALGIPLSAGVMSRLLLDYYAADLSLEGSFLAGLILAGVRLSQREIVRSAEGACPFCGTRQRLGLAGRKYRLPRRVPCSSCGQELDLDPIG